MSPQIKPTLPLGQLSLLTVDGTVYPQSMAATRYAGHLTGLYPTDALEALKVDVVSETVCEATNVPVDIKYRTPEAERAGKTKTFLEEVLPKSFFFG
jgi:glutathione S-transferase